MARTAEKPAGEARIVSAVVREGEEKLAAKDREIVGIQSKIDDLGRELVSLRTGRDAEIARREQALRDALAAELAAERQRLEKTGTAASALEKQLAALDQKRTTELEQQLAAYRKQMDAELAAKEKEIDARFAAYQRDLADARSARTLLEKDLAESQASGAAAVSEQQRLARELAAVTEQSRREELALGQLTTAWQSVNDAMKAGLWDRALQGLDAITGLLAQDAVASLPAVQRTGCGRRVPRGEHAPAGGSRPGRSRRRGRCGRGPGGGVPRRAGGGEVHGRRHEGSARAVPRGHREAAGAPDRLRAALGHGRGRDRVVPAGGRGRGGPGRCRLRGRELEDRARSVREGARPAAGHGEGPAPRGLAHRRCRLPADDGGAGGPAGPVRAHPDREGRRPRAPRGPRRGAGDLRVGRRFVPAQLPGEERGRRHLERRRRADQAERGRDRRPRDSPSRTCRPWTRRRRRAARERQVAADADWRRRPPRSRRR